VSSTNSTAGLHYFQPTESIAGNSAAANQQLILVQNPCSATQVLPPITTQFRSNNPAATATTMTTVTANVSNYEFNGRLEHAFPTPPFSTSTKHYWHPCSFSSTTFTYKQLSIGIIIATYTNT
jgi:hypothetical protein